MFKIFVFFRILRVITTRIATSDNDDRLLQSLDVEVQSILLVKRAILLARKQETPDEAIEQL
jgi:hypothetical protein